MAEQKNHEYFANCTVAELLDEPEVRGVYRGLHIFFGESEFGRLVVFLKGYDAALLELSPEKSCLTASRNG